MTDLKTLLKSATLPERVVSIVMDRALVAEFQRLEDELAKATERRTQNKRLSAASSPTAIAEKIEALRGKMRESTVEFTLRGSKASAWRELKARHPLGDDPTDTDRVLGADANSLFNEAVRAAIVSPVVDDEDWTTLVEVLTEGEWDRLVNAVYALNEEGTGVPFSRASSTLLQASDVDSK